MNQLLDQLPCLFHPGRSADFLRAEGFIILHQFHDLMFLLPAHPRHPGGHCLIYHSYPCGQGNIRISQTDLPIIPAPMKSAG